MTTRRLVFETMFHLGAAHYLRRVKRDSLTILSLHRVTDERNPFFQPLRPAAFDGLLTYLKRHYTIVDCADLPTLPAQGRKPCLLLSFDDGYYDFVQYAMPILEKHGMRANHNIVNACANGTDIIWTERLNYICLQCWQRGIALSFEDEGLGLSLSGSGGNWIAFNLAVFQRLLRLERAVRLPILARKEEQYGIHLETRMMNWDEVRQCADYGIEIGSHTYTHDVLSTIRDPATLHHELSQSRREMEQQLGREVCILALPNGEGTALSDAATREAGFRYLLYVENKINPVAPAADMQTLYRIGVQDEPLSEAALRIEMFHSKLRRPNA